MVRTISECGDGGSRLSRLVLWVMCSIPRPSCFHPGARRLGVAALMLMSAALGLGLACPSGAAARSFHPFLEAFGAQGQPTFSEAAGAAVDQVTGDLLVIDVRAKTVSRWKPDGTAADFSALGTNVIDAKLGAGGKPCAEEPSSCDKTPQSGFSFPTGSSGAREVEVAVAPPGSAGGTGGDIYVTQGSRHLVDVFASSGEYLGQLTEYSGGGFGESCGVSVGPGGDVFVGDYQHGIHKFAPSANPPVKADNVANFAFESPCTLAAGAGVTAGSIFVDRWTGSLFKLDGSTGKVEYQLAGSSGQKAVAVDPGTGHVYSASEEGVTEFDAFGTSGPGLVSTIEPGGEPLGVAVNEASGDVYVSGSGASHLEVYGPLEVVPLVVTGPASDLASDSATFNGTVNPEGVEVTECFFEWGETESPYEHRLPCAETAGEIGSGRAAVPVQADLGGLAAGVRYRYRLVAANANASGTGLGRSFRLAAPFPPPPAFGPCANDPLRGGYGADLPDCRAYEQVSPPDKNGNAIQPGLINDQQAAADGSAATFIVKGGIPGGTGAQGYPTYLARRGADGWATQGIFPPARLGEAAAVLGLTGDLSASYSRAGGPGPVGLYAREGAAGAITQMAAVPGGEEESSYDYVGASRDGAEVALESTAKLAPGALAGAPNVYVWDRAGGRVSLAGVLNDGSVPAGGVHAGPYDWFFEKTGAGGSNSKYYTQDERAISSDGSRLFFTAVGSGQLYVRENPSAPQSPVDGSGRCTVPSDACTIHVSASQKTDGRGPGGTDLAGVRKAAFMSAAADGSSALFTSPEKLTNDATTGTEPAPPAIARAEIGGTKADLEFLPATAAGIAVDGSHIYWADPQGGSIRRAELDGEGEEELVTGLDQPEAVAVDSEHLYWAAVGGGEAGEGSIGRAGLDGGNPHSCVTGASDPLAVAVDAAHVYWTDSATSSTAASVGRADLDCSDSSQEFVSGIGRVGQKTLYGLTVSATKVYFMDFNGSSAYRIGCASSIDGGDYQVNCGDLYLGAIEGRAIAIDGSHIYWAQAGTSTVGRADLDSSGLGSNPDQSFITGAENPRGLVVDSGHLYWSTSLALGGGNPGNDLYRWDASTGKLADLTPDPAEEAQGGAEVQGVLGASPDGSYVYFVANGVLAAGASPGDCAGSAAGGFFNLSGACNLYLRHGGATAYIARLDAGGGVHESDAANWQPSSNSQPDREEATARVSADGRALLFRSQAQLTDYANEGVPEFYLYRAGGGGGTLTCVSCDPTGAAAGGPPELQGGGVHATSAPAAILTRNLSAGGKRVFFNSPDSLVARDTDGVTDVYEWEAKGEGSCAGEAQDGGCLYLISSGGGEFADADASGENVFFFTRRSLVGQDGDDLSDLYDARVGGGLASQAAAAEAAPCVGEACRGPAGGGVAEPFSPASLAFSGPGNALAGHGCGRSATARRLRGRARELRRRAKRAEGRRARRLRRRSQRLARRAHRASDVAKKCGKANGRTGRREVVKRRSRKLHRHANGRSGR